MSSPAPPTADPALRSGLGSWHPLTRLARVRSHAHFIQVPGMVRPGVQKINGQNRNESGPRVDRTPGRPVLEAQAAQVASDGTEHCRGRGMDGVTQIIPQVARAGCAWSESWIREASRRR